MSSRLLSEELDLSGTALTGLSLMLRIVAPVAIAAAAVVSIVG